MKAVKWNYTLGKLILILSLALQSFAGTCQISSAQNGNWEVGSTWIGGSVPSSTDEVIINHTVEILTNITRSAKTQINQNGTIQLYNTIINGGEMRVNGSVEIKDGGDASGNFFIYNGLYSRLIFANGSNNDYGVNAGQAFWPADANIPHTVIVKNKRVIITDADHSVYNMVLEGGLICAENKIIKVKNTLEIKSNGYLAIAKSDLNKPHPEYAEGATLIYNSGNVTNNAYGIGHEWRNNSIHAQDAGPYHVEIKGNTFLNYRNIIEERKVRGNLTIESGSGLFMDYGEPENEGDAIKNSGPLSVDGNAVINGAFSMGKKYGEDLKLKGDLIFGSGYSFYANNRAIWFLKLLSLAAPDPQDVQTPLGADLTIPYIVVGDVTDPANSFNDPKTSGLKINQHLTIGAPNDDRAIRFRSKNDFVDMNGFNLTIGEDRASISISNPTFIDGGGFFKGHQQSSLYLNGGGNTGTLNFHSESQKLNNLIINKHPITGAGGTVVTGAVLGTPLTLLGTGSYFQNGVLAIGNNNLIFEEKSAYNRDNGFVDATGKGTVSKVFNKAEEFMYPVGDTVGSTHFTPAVIYLAPENGKIQTDVNLKKEKHPQNNQSSNYINRYWNVKATSNTFNNSYKANATFYYHADDAFGNESLMFTSGYASPNWYVYLQADKDNKTLSLTGETNLNKAFTGGDNFSPMASSPNNYFRSKQNGNWQNVNSWQSSFNKTHWNDATLSPTQESKGIHIQTAHTINVNTPVFLDQTEVNGTLQLSTGGVLNINNGMGNDIEVMDGGRLLITHSGTYGDAIKLPPDNDFLTAAINVQTEGAIVVGEGINSTGTGYENLAILQNFRWQDKARFVWNNGRAFATSGVTYFPTASENTIPHFIIGTPVTTGSSPNPTQINGLFIVNAQTNLGGTGTKTFRNGIAGSDSLTQVSVSDGRFIIEKKDAILGGSNLKLKLNHSLYLKQSIIIPKDSMVVIHGNNIDNNQTAGSILTIEGIFDMTDKNIVNTNSFIEVTSTGKYRTKHSGGFTGTLSSIPSGNINLHKGSTIEFYSENDQNFNTRADFSNLIFSGGGKKKPSGSFAPNGMITIKDDAILDCTGYNVGNENTDLTMEAGRLILTTTGLQPKMEGAYNLSGGVIEFLNSQTTLQTIRPAQYFNIEVTGKSVSNSSGKIEIRPNGSFVVKDGGVYTSSSGNAPIAAMNDIANNQTLKIETGGTFRTAVTEGFYGPKPADILEKSSSVQNSIPNIILEPNSTIEYARKQGTLPATASDGDQKITFDETAYTYQDLILTGDGNKTAPALLKIKGDFTIRKDATYKHNNGLVEFNGSTKQNIVSFNNTTFYDLENKNTSSLQIGPDNLELNEKGYPIGIKNRLHLTSNSKLHLVGGDITIISDAQGTGRVESIPLSASIAYDKGRFKIERYIPNHPKAWQLLSSNTSGGSIKEAWQNNQENTAGRGVNITGPYWTAGASHGFDAYSPAPSMKWHNQETNLFKGITSTENNLDDHPAYFLFVRGDRSVTGPYQPATAVTLHTRGKLYAPNNLPPSITIKPEKWELLGNPYASSIDFDKLQTSGGQIEASYYIWDPNLTQLTVNGGYSEFGLGAYRAVTKVDGNYIAVPPVDPLIPDAAYPTLQSGQGFYVRNASETTDAVISFGEQLKTSETQNVFRTGNISQNQTSKIMTNLFVHNGENQILVDGTMHLFNNEYNPNVDEQDVKKMANSSENISLQGNKYPLIIDRRPFATEGDSLYYLLRGLAKKQYTLQVHLSAMDAGNHEVYLNDKYRQSAQLLNEGANSFDFIVNDEPASGQKDRFYLTFKKMPLPFRFVAEKSQVERDRINIKWTAENQNSVETYLVEHSLNEEHFIPLHSVAVSGGESENYHFTHNEPGAGMNHYRIKAILKDGNSAYSKTLNSFMEYRTPALSVYPNPVVDRMQINFYRQPQGKYQIQIRDSKGSLVKSATIEHTGFAVAHPISVAGLTSGLYMIELRKPDGSSHFEKIVIR